MWFGVQGEYTAVDDPNVEGSPFNRNVFLSLMVAGLFVLSKRRLAWRTVFRENKWMYVLFIYFLISTLWSDLPFVSLKRWIKNFGNIVMVLVVLTEEDPVRAMQTAFLRCAYILMPLSVLFIKYYADIGR